MNDLLTLIGNIFYNRKQISEGNKRLLEDIQLLHHQDYIDAITDRSENFSDRIKESTEKLPEKYRWMIEETTYYKTINGITYVGVRR